MCKYCEGEVDDRTILLTQEFDYFDEELYIDGNNNLTTDNMNGNELKINFCPMCGRELKEVL